MIVITRTFYLESASILFDNNRRSQFRAGRGGATRFEYKKKKKEKKEGENTVVNTPLSDLQLSVQLHGYRIYRIAFFSGSNFVLGLVAVRSPPGSGSSILKKMIGMWLRLVTCSNRFLRVRFMEGKLSCFIFSFFFVFSPEFQSRSTDFELLHRIISLSEFNKFNKGRICRSRKKIRRSVYEYVIESRSCWNRATDLRSILRNGFKYDERDTAWHEIVTRITSYLYREPVLLYDYAACRVAAISEEKGKRENIFTENPETS